MNFLLPRHNSLQTSGEQICLQILEGGAEAEEGRCLRGNCRVELRQGSTEGLLDKSAHAVNGEGEEDKSAIEAGFGGGDSLLARSVTPAGRSLFLQEFLPSSLLPL